jgi:hypothetical protein
LEAVGACESTFSAIATKAGGSSPLPSGSLSPVLATLRAKRVLDRDRPLSTKPDSKNARYRISDTYLRFWLAFLARGIPQVERGRPDLVLERIERSWQAWRGRAVEPLVRESVLRLLPDDGWPGTEAVGGWWNRQNNPEVDLVGTDSEPVAGTVHFCGSVKWCDCAPFGRREYDRLVRDAVAVPGAAEDTALVAVSRSGFVSELPLAAAWGPDELVAAWSRASGHR